MARLTDETVAAIEEARRRRAAQTDNGDALSVRTNEESELSDDARMALPDGYRPWDPDVDDVHAVPMLDVAAYVGPVGEYLHLIEGRTEAHPAAVGLQVLASLGTLIGRRAVYVAGRLVHHCNLFGAVVGPSALGAKGSADAEAFALVNLVCPSFLPIHGLGGLGSGEALVRELEDKPERRSPDGQRLIAEASNPEKRRIIHSAELSAVLRVIRREGSILGDIVRQAYDYGPLRHHTIGHGKAVAVDHHVAVVGSITPTELVALVDELSISNGFLNRFLLVWSERVVSLPHGGRVDEPATAAIADTIRKALDDLHDRRPDFGGSCRFRFTTAAAERWEAFYAERRPSIGATEMLRSINARQVAHAARLSLIYAAVAGARYIGLDHLEAAIAWCDYSAMTAELVFGGAERTADERVLQVVRRSMPSGIPKTLVHRRLPHGWPAGWITGAIDDFVEQRLLWVVKDPGGAGTGSGRRVERVVALSHVTGKGRKEGTENLGC